MSVADPIIQRRPSGLYCAAGDFYIDPWKAVDRAVITHAHADHARVGSKSYLCAEVGKNILRKRMGRSALIETLPYGEVKSIGDARVSLHPAGHILGSAQVRIEVGGEVWVAGGDFNNTADDRTCAPFEVVPCDTFITESTFGLPIYRWPKPESVFREIEAWWSQNQRDGLTSVLPAYPLGKSQRLLGGLDATIGPIAVHGSVADYVPLYEEAGVPLAKVVRLSEMDEAGFKAFKGKGLIISSAAAKEVGLIRKCAPLSWAFASGWMMTRGARRQRDFDRGFILSDHADWHGLVSAIKATGASQVGVTHGSTGTFARWLREEGWEAFTFETFFSGESPDEGMRTAKQAPE